MLYDIYTAIKEQLNANVNDLKGVEWYNVQYEGSIANTPRIFIEFPDQLDFSQIEKTKRRAPIKIRLHVVTQAIASHDGTVSDTIAQEHEITATEAKSAIDKFTPLNGTTGLTSPLQFSGWKHYHKHKGWMVTFVEFDGKIFP